MPVRFHLSTRKAAVSLRNAQHYAMCSAVRAMGDLVQILVLSLLVQSHATCYVDDAMWVICPLPLSEMSMSRPEATFTAGFRQKQGMAIVLTASSSVYCTTVL